MKNNFFFSVFYPNFFRPRQSIFVFPKEKYKIGKFGRDNGRIKEDIKNRKMFKLYCKVFSFQYLREKIKEEKYKQEK